jgi:hypothetical protein
MTPSELEARVHAELRPGETVVWHGQPIPKRLATSSRMIFLICFGTFFMMVAMCVLTGSMTCVFSGLDKSMKNGSWVIFPLVCIPFMLIGLFIITIPYWVYRSAKWQSYAVTNQRAIVWKAGIFGRVKMVSYTPKDITKLIRRDRKDGCGDLIFHSEVTYYRDNDGDLQSSRNEYGFYAIADVRKVERIVHELVASSRE